MINTKEINELMYAMHDPINVLPAQPIWRWFRINSHKIVVEYQCPICWNSIAMELNFPSALIVDDQLIGG